MTPAEQTLVFTHTPFSIAVSVGFVLLVMILAFIGWQRSGYRAAIGWLELLRVLICAGIAITLNQPEWKETFKPDSKPTLAILHDVSRSMDTRDVIDATKPNASAKTRAEAAQPLIQLQLWDSLKKRMDVVIEPFSSSDQPPEEGTDINAALLSLMENQPRLSAVVLLSDGDRNTGESPALAATRLRMRGVPVFSVPMGSESRLPDVELVSFDVPTFAVAGKPLRIPFASSSVSNQQFVRLDNAFCRELRKTMDFDVIQPGETESIVRFCTSWATLPENIDALLAEIQRLKNK